MAYIDLGNVKGEKGDRGLQGKGTAFFGKCDTNSDISIKDIKLIEDSIVEPYDGLVIFVKFTHENNSSVLSLTIDGETTFAVDTDETVSWKAGDSVLFAFAENKWHYLEGTGTPFNTKTGVVNTETLNVGEQENYHTEVKTDSSDNTKTGGLNGTITGNRLILKSKTGEDIEKLPSFNGTTVEDRFNEFGGIETNGYIAAPFAKVSNYLSARAIEATDIMAATVHGNTSSFYTVKNEAGRVLAPVTLYKGNSSGGTVTLSQKVEKFDYIEFSYGIRPNEDPNNQIGTLNWGVQHVRMHKSLYQIPHFCSEWGAVGDGNNLLMQGLYVVAVGSSIYVKVVSGHSMDGSGSTIPQQYRRFYILWFRADSNSPYKHDYNLDYQLDSYLNVYSVTGWR